MHLLSFPFSDLIPAPSLPDNIICCSSLYSLTSLLVAMQYYSPGYHPPSWATPEVREQLDTLGLYFLSFVYNTVTKQRLSAGGCGLGVA